VLKLSVLLQGLECFVFLEAIFVDFCGENCCDNGYASDCMQKDELLHL